MVLSHLFFKGMFAPTSGEIYIHDYNIRTQLNQVRDLLGLCPQHNMLFTDLTVLEHLIFFARVSYQSLFSFIILFYIMYLIFS